MNLVGFMGVVVKKEIKPEVGMIVIRIPRPFLSEKEHDDFDVEVNKKAFIGELRAIRVKDVVGIKGRLQTDSKGAVRLIAERIQLF